MAVAKSRPRPVGEYITKESFKHPSHRDWHALRQILLITKAESKERE